MPVDEAHGRKPGRIFATHTARQATADLVQWIRQGVILWIVCVCVLHVLLSIRGPLCSPWRGGGGLGRHFAMLFPRGCGDTVMCRLIKGGGLQSGD